MKNPHAGRGYKFILAIEKAIIRRIDQIKNPGLHKPPDPFIRNKPGWKRIAQDVVRRRKKDDS